MKHSYWLIVIFVAMVVCNTRSRPQDIDIKNVYPVYRPSKELDLTKSNSTVEAVTERTSTTATAKPEDGKDRITGIEAIATVARASSDDPSLSPSVAKVADQLIDTMGQMIETDIRTPPKLKEIIKEKTDVKSNETKKEESAKVTSTQVPVTVKSEVLVDKIEANGKFELPDANERPSSLSLDSSEGKASSTKKKEEDNVKGIAVPVIMDELDVEHVQPPKKLQKIPEVPKPVKDDKKKPKPSRDNPTTTPSSGLSTWILLSDNRESTTPSVKKTNNKTTEKSDKKTTTTKKPGKIQTTTAKPIKDDKTKNPANQNKKVTTKAPNQANKKENDGLTALEAMVKNQKKVPTTQKPEFNTKIVLKKPDSKKKPDKISERIDEAETKDKVEIELTDKRVTIPPSLIATTDDPTTVAITDSSNSVTTTDATQEGTTKKKKSSSKKKKKKNKNRRRKPANKNSTDVELKNSSKNPKQPVGAQLYNFLSREIMPTVGLGLVGVLVTAGLAGLLGYNPFVSGNLPIRRTYEAQHGYSPNNNNYYTYNTGDYGDGGQSEEVLFREVLSGMPEDSRYGLTNTDNSYPESQVYNSQEKVYDSMKQPVDANYPNADETTYDSNYPQKQDSNYPQEYSNVYGSTYNADGTKYTGENADSQKYPMYDRETGTSFVYPEEATPEKSSRLNDEMDGSEGSKYQYDSMDMTEGNEKMSSKYSNKKDTIERQPEALYRVAAETKQNPYQKDGSTVQGVSSQNSWHRIGSPMDYRQLPYLEPGPRSLDLSKEAPKEAKSRKKRTSESVIQRISRRKDLSQNTDSYFDNDKENEIEFESSSVDSLVKKETTTSIDDISTTASSTSSRSTTVSPTTTLGLSTEEISTLKSETSTEGIKTSTEEIKDVAGNQISTEEAITQGSVTTKKPITLLESLKILANYKLKTGLTLLKTVTNYFWKYLDDLEKKIQIDNVDTDTWSRSLFKRKRTNAESMPIMSNRMRRSTIEDKKNLGLKLKNNERYFKNKELKSSKVMNPKKKIPRKFKSKMN